MVAPTAPPAGPQPALLLVQRQLRRSRLSSFFRLLLVIPHALVLVVLYVALAAVSVAGWFTALVLGRLPAGMHEFLAGVLAWNIRVNGYLWLLTDDYPPFAFQAPGYPLQVQIPPPGRLRRWAVFGRIVLVLPAYVMSLLLSGLNLFLVFAWFAAVFAGRLPRAVFDALATGVRYQLRVAAYLLLLTPTYPWGVAGDGVEHGAPQAWPQPGYGPPLPPGYGPPPAYGPPPPVTAPPGFGPPPAPPAPPSVGSTAYPPMPPAVTAPEREPGWYDGMVTTGGRAILIVAFVLGALDLAGYASGFGGGGGLTVGFGQVTRTYDLTRDGARFDQAVDNASCDGPGDCTQSVAASLLAASARLRKDAEAEPSSAARSQLVADLARFDAEVSQAAAAGDLVDASGDVLPEPVLTTETQVDQDVTRLLRASR